MGRIVYIIITISLACLAILFREQLQFYFNNLWIYEYTYQNGKIAYTPEELAQYNGISRDKIYIAVIGSIFDVSKGIQHYGQGSPYNYFVGKDGSRAFITGNFKDESGNKDHVLDLTCDELLILTNWKRTFREKYKYVGKAIGRYFDYDGGKTEYMKQLGERINHCKDAKEIAKRDERKYPPCNISWSAEEGTRVWCTTSSGGVTRNWAGVPRQMFTPGEPKPRCVCVNTNYDSQTGLFKEYENCSSNSNSCYIKT